MCGGGGSSTFVPKYDRGYSGQSGGTVIPTRVYNNALPELYSNVNTSTFAAYDGAILMTGSGSYYTYSYAPTTGGNTGNPGVGGGWGAKGGGQTYGEFIASFVAAGNNSAKAAQINTGTAVTIHNINATPVDPNNIAGPMNYAYGANGNVQTGAIWTHNAFGGLGGSAIVTNGNSVTIAGNTGNIYGAIS